MTELSSTMRRLGMNPSEAELRDMVNEVDTDGNGDIDLAEFIALMVKKLQSHDAEGELIEAFKVFDLESNGLV